MPDAKKFLFDQNNFDGNQPEEVVYTEEQMMLAKSQSLAAGKAEGMRETQAQQEARIGDLLQKTLIQTENLVRNEERRELEKCGDTVRLAMQVVHKLLPGFARQYALPEIERVILQSIEARRDEPRIAITVPTAHLEALKSRVESLSAGKAYAGKVILIADDTLAETDCRVEWADGGAERLFERLFSQIDNEFAKAVTGVATTLDPETDNTNRNGEQK